LGSPLCSFVSGIYCSLLLAMRHHKQPSDASAPIRNIYCPLLLNDAPMTRLNPQ
jgi:hypothetical protein